jgi:hypothetical protein
MESQALQGLVKKIFSDEEIRTQFMANPDSVLSQFSLTEDERKAVLNTHARLGLMTSDSAQLAATIEPNMWWT